MKTLHFIQVEKDNPTHYKLFNSLMVPYFEELDSHRRDELPIQPEATEKYTRGMINMQGPHDRHLELCYDGGTLVGFHYCKVDHVGHKGFIKPEYGYIMEFYVKPEFRRNGIGTSMFHRMEKLFSDHGTKRMYLTSDPVTGEPFWKTLGFENTAEISPENQLSIFEKDVQPVSD